MTRPERLSPEIVQRLRARDRAAFEECYRRFKDDLLRIASRLLADAHEAEDALHDIFLRVWDDVPSFRADSDFGTWIYRVAVNHCLNRLARRRRWKLLAGRRKETATPTPSLDAERLLAGVAPEFRVCLILKDMEEFAHEEIAEMLGIPVGTVMSRVSRAREQVRENFQRRKDSGMI